MNVWPQKRGNVGNGSEPSTQLTSKSFLRSTGSQQPGRMSSYVVAVIVMSVLSNFDRSPFGVETFGMATNFFWT